MRLLTATALGALVTAAALTASGALAGGGPPPADPQTAALRTVVAHGTAPLKVAVPAHRSNKTIERAVLAARGAAYPKAVKGARRDASALAAAAGLRLTGPLGAARDVSPYGYWDSDSGRFGLGKWCGRIVTRTHDGTRRSHIACPVPRDLQVRITVTFGVR
jgi:hypothetical protein